jgi:hypothetical protein
MDQHGSREVVGRIDDEGYKEDEDIKKASSKLKMTRNPDLRQGKLLLEDASLLKIQFTFIGRLASMYSEISGRFQQRRKSSKTSSAIRRKVFAR